METLKLIIIPILLLFIFLLGMPVFGLWTDVDFERVLEANREDDIIEHAQSLSNALSGQPELFHRPQTAAPEEPEQQRPPPQAAPPAAAEAEAPVEAPPPETVFDPRTVELTTPILIDGDLTDWQTLIDSSALFGAAHADGQDPGGSPPSLGFRHYAGMRGQYLYAAFDVRDDRVVYRDRNTLRLDRSDHLKIIIGTAEGKQTFIVTGNEPGWVNGFFIPEEPERNALFESRIQGTWTQNDDGYTLEIRIRADLLGDTISFAIADVDDPETGAVAALIGTGPREEAAPAAEEPTGAGESGIVERDLPLEKAEPEGRKEPDEAAIDTAAVAAVLGLHHDPPARLRVIDRELRVIAEIGELDRFGPGTPGQPAGLDPEMLTAVFSGGRTIARSFDGEGPGGVIAAAIPLTYEEEVVAAVVAEKATDIILFSTRQSYRDAMTPFVIAFLVSSAGLYLFALGIRPAA